MYHRSHNQQLRLVCGRLLDCLAIISDMVAKFRELGRKRDVDIGYFGTIVALWSLDVPENML